MKELPFPKHQEKGKGHSTMASHVEVKVHEAQQPKDI